MSCTKHFLVFNWKHHEWQRQVTQAESLEERLTDMWGQPFDERHVLCHTQYVCSDCGKVVDATECTCEPERGDRCPIRLKYLALHTGPDERAH